MTNPKVRITIRPSIREMLRIMFLLSAWFDLVLCDIHSGPSASQALSCRDSPLCYLSDKTYKPESKSLSLLPHPNSQNYGMLQRSYYSSGYGSSTSPAYYHAFDPISVLASLAFLAFLLQSFASLFERSRSILPTIVSGRQSTVDLTIPEVSRHVSGALQEYENVNGHLDANK